MNAPQITDNRVTAFVFGAVFSWLSMGGGETLLIYTVKSILGGIIWLLFQLTANFLERRLRQYEEKLLASEKKYDANTQEKTRAEQVQPTQQQDAGDGKSSGQKPN